MIAGCSAIARRIARLGVSVVPGAYFDCVKTAESGTHANPGASHFPWIADETVCWACSPWECWPSSRSQRAGLVPISVRPLRRCPRQSPRPARYRRRLQRSMGSIVIRSKRSCPATRANRNQNRRPQIQRPQIQRPQIQRPQNRRPQIQRPQIQRPQIQRRLPPGHCAGRSSVPSTTWRCGQNPRPSPTSSGPWRLGPPTWTSWMLARPQPLRSMAGCRCAFRRPKRAGSIRGSWSASPSTSTPASAATPMRRRSPTSLSVFSTGRSERAPSDLIDGFRRIRCGSAGSGCSARFRPDGCRSRRRRSVIGQRGPNPGAFPATSVMPAARRAWNRSTKSSASTGCSAARLSWSMTSLTLRTVASMTVRSTWRR